MSVTAPLGFRAAGVTAGLKQSGQPDVAVVLNDGPSRAAAAVFTSNRVQAAPVTWTRQVVTGGRVRAVVLNSGGANACTGAPGFHAPPMSSTKLPVDLSTRLIWAQNRMNQLMYRSSGSFPYSFLRVSANGGDVTTRSTLLLGSAERSWMASIWKSTPLGVL